MKKAISVLLAVILTALCAVPALASGEDAAAEKGASFGAYDHVFIIGVDGWGRFFSTVDTPEFDRIFADGAVTYGARAETITVSAQNWGSIFTGVSFLRHKMTNDSIDENERGSSTKFPSVFAYARQAYPEAELASFVHWNPINYGLIENDIDVFKAHEGDDEVLTDAVVDYFNAGNAPKLFYCHFDDVDHAGHSYGCKSDEYLNAIARADMLLGRIYDAVAQNGLMENGLFLVVADHGHTVPGGHGGLTARETDVTLAVKGKTVEKGGAFEKDTRNRDVCAITLYALGIDQPEYMSCRVPGGLFENEAGFKRNNRHEALDVVFAALAGVITGIARKLER